MSDATFAELRRHLGGREIVEITWLNALENYYNLPNLPLGIEAVASRPIDVISGLRSGARRRVGTLPIHERRSELREPAYLFGQDDASETGEAPGGVQCARLRRREAEERRLCRTRLVVHGG